jgi:hypothetical protein
MKKLKTYYYLDKICSGRNIYFYKITTDIDYDLFINLIYDEAHKFLDSFMLENKEKFLNETQFERNDYTFNFKGNEKIKILSRTGADKEKIKKAFLKELNPSVIEMDNRRKRNNVFYYLDCINLPNKEQILFYKILSDHYTKKDFFYNYLIQVRDQFNYENDIEYDYWINDYNIDDYEDDYIIPFEYDGKEYYFSHFTLMLKHERKNRLIRRLTPIKIKILTEDII